MTVTKLVVSLVISFLPLGIFYSYITPCQISNLFIMRLSEEPYIQVFKKYGHMGIIPTLNENYDEYSIKAANGTISYDQVTADFAAAIERTRQSNGNVNITIKDMVVIKYVGSLSGYNSEVSAALKGMGNTQPFATRNFGGIKPLDRRKVLIIPELERKLRER
jgi:hypothetical protein